MEISGRRRLQCSEGGVVTRGGRTEAMDVMRESETVILAVTCGRAEGRRLRRETCPPKPSLQQTHRQLEEVESTGKPSAAQVSCGGGGEGGGKILHLHILHNGRLTCIPALTDWRMMVFRNTKSC